MAVDPGWDPVKAVSQSFRTLTGGMEKCGQEAAILETQEDIFLIRAFWEHLLLSQIGQ